MGLMNFSVRAIGIGLALWCSVPVFSQDTLEVDQKVDTVQSHGLPFSYYYSFSKNLVTPRLWKPAEHKRHLMLTGHGTGQSSNAVAGVWNAILLEKPVDGRDIQQSVDNLRDANRAGMELGSEMSYHHFNGSRIWYAGFSTNSIAGMEYGRDIFQLGFQGNAPFEDANASLGPMSGSWYEYNQLRGGMVFSAVRDSLHLNVGIGVGLNQGTNLLELNVPGGSLFTAAHGEYIDLDLQFEALHTSGGGFMNVKGGGASLDFSIGAIKGQQQLVVQVIDLGFIRWNGLHRVAADTAIHFDGIEVNNLFGGDGLPAIDTDSLQHYVGVESSTLDKTTMTPAVFRVVYAQLFPQAGFYLGGGAEYRMIDGYWPLFFVKGEKYFEKPALIGAAKLAYGGFGGFAMGLELRKQFWNRVGITIGTNGLLGLSVPGTFGNTSLYAGIGVSF